MSWLNDPRYKPIRDSVVGQMQRKSYRFRRSKRVAFVCGGFESERRRGLIELLLQDPQNLAFKAEDVWNAIAENTNLSALEIEAELAALADIVIIIVESPGTFAELGAFSLSEPLRKKLLPILDKLKRKGASFIETGPVRWIDRTSKFQPSIWTDMNGFLLCGDEVQKRMERITQEDLITDDVGASPRHLLFFLCDVVSVVGPCPADHIEFFLTAILQKPVADVHFLLALGVALGQLSRSANGYYSRVLVNGLVTNFHHTSRFVDLGHLHASVMSVMQKIPSANAALKELQRP